MSRSRTGGPLYRCVPSRLAGCGSTPALQSKRMQWGWPARGGPETQNARGFSGHERYFEYIGNRSNRQEFGRTLFAPYRLVPQLRTMPPERWADDDLAWRRPVDGRGSSSRARAAVARMRQSASYDARRRYPDKRAAPACRVCRRASRGGDRSCGLRTCDERCTANVAIRPRADSDWMGMERPSFGHQLAVTGLGWLPRGRLLANLPVILIVPRPPRSRGALRGSAMPSSNSAVCCVSMRPRFSFGRAAVRRAADVHQDGAAAARRHAVGVVGRHGVLPGDAACRLRLRACADPLLCRAGARSSCTSS